MGELVRARDHRGLSLTISFWRTKEGEEIDFLVQIKGQTKSRWLAIEAKMAIQGVRPVPIPNSLARELPDLQELWIVTPGGSPSKVSSWCRQTPIMQLANRLEELAEG